RAVFIMASTIAEATQRLHYLAVNRRGAGCDLVDAADIRTKGRVQQKRSSPMSHFRPSSFLRRSLILDAVASGATGALMLAGAGLLEGWLGLPAALLRAAGLVLVPYVAFVGYLATRETLTPAAVWTVVAANGLWAAAS